MSRINVLIFSNYLICKNDIKGTGNWVHTLLDELRKNKEFSYIVAFHDSSVNKIKFESNNDLQLVRIPLLYKPNIFTKFLSNWLITDKFINATKNYLEVINQIKPDIIQIFGLESPFIRIIGKVNQPLVIHIQGLIAPYIYKYFPRFNFFEILRTKRYKKILSGNNPFNIKREMYKHLKIENEIYCSIKYCLGRTDWDRRCIKAIAPNAQYFYCQEIMRQPFYNVNWVPPNNGKYIFYTTTSDNFYKNVDMIYETCNIIEKFNKKLNFQWRVAGITDDDITPKIMRKKKLSPKNIILLGNLGAQEIIKELINANAFIYPSAIDNSPNAVEEAMLSGIPIIATFAGGVNSVIDNNITGILVNEGDPYVLAGAIVEMLENYNDAIVMGANAKKIALHRHNPQKVANKLLNIYKSICDEQK